MLTEAYRGGHLGRPGWRIKFDYDADAIEALKRAVPPASRSWNEEQKYWWVAGEYEAEVLGVFPTFEAHLRQASLFE